MEGEFDGMEGEFDGMEGEFDGFAGVSTILEEVSFRFATKMKITADTRTFSGESRGILSNSPNLVGAHGK